MNDLEIIGPRLTYSCALDTSVILRCTIENDSKGGCCCCLENNELEYIVVGEFGSAAATHVSKQRGVKLSRAAGELDFPCSIASHKPAGHSPRALNFEAEGGFGEREDDERRASKALALLPCWIG